MPHALSIEEREAPFEFAQGPPTYAKRLPSIETKGCLNEAEGGVSSFCQVFFGYFL